MTHITQLTRADCELMAEQGTAAVVKESKHFILVAIDLSYEVIIVVIVIIADVKFHHFQ